MRPLPSLLSTLALLAAAAGATAQDGWKTPPPAIQKILDVPPTPSVVLSPSGETMVLVQTVPLPPLEDMAAPMLRLAGSRINPRTNGRHGPRRYEGFTLVDIATGARRSVELPAGSNVSSPSFSPDGSHFSFTRTTDQGIELWVVSIADGKARALTPAQLNGTGAGPRWLDDEHLLCMVVDPARGPAPQRPAVPAGPVVQESTGKKAPVRTYQDLLRDDHDAALFDHYFRSVPVRVSLDGTQVDTLGAADLYRSVSPSPDGSSFLVTTLRRPYSYLHPSYAFPSRIELWDRDGKRVTVLSEKPLRDQVPLGGVETGPRSIQWRDDAPCSLVWVEALDGGDPKAEVDHRDRLMVLDAPFDAGPSQRLLLEHRFSSISALEGEHGSLIDEYDRDRRWRRTWLLDLDDPIGTLRLVHDRSTQDYYGDPGRALTRRGADGVSRVRVHEGSIYLAGSGSSPEGDHPFLDRLALDTLQTTRLWRCEGECYESVVGLLADDASRFVTRRESEQEPPNYFLRADDRSRALTDFPHPYPELAGIRKELVQYERDDGLPLSATLYLPSDYREGERRPMLVWAYPREYNDKRTAGQVRGSPHRFPRISGSSHLFLLTQGYVVMDGAAMPVVGDPETANDTFVDQIVAAAAAAIAEADRRGVCDPERVGVGGHSYGAFMTANLLAHSDLFKAGVARSGAYNRTLTPFGFQNERRTFWEAPMTYFAMSPFMHAPKVDEPLLMIHGQIDNNSGTFPIQSERLYHAIKGNGGHARLVMLPYESHGYRGRESVQHVLAEMVEWFDQHVKGSASPAGSGS